METQEVFDRVVTHLLRQGRKSRKDGAGCLYRGPEGTMCAVGCLIPDEAYDPRMESMGVHDLIDKFPAVSWMKEHASILSRLQGTHDVADPADWEDELRRIASTRGLEFNALEAS